MDMRHGRMGVESKAGRLRVQLISGLPWAGLCLWFTQHPQRLPHQEHQSAPQVTEMNEITNGRRVFRQIHSFQKLSLSSKADRQK